MFGCLLVPRQCINRDVDKRKREQSRVPGEILTLLDHSARPRCTHDRPSSVIFTDAIHLYIYTVYEAKSERQGIVERSAIGRYSKTRPLVALIMLLGTPNSYANRLWLLLGVSLTTTICLVLSVMDLGRAQWMPTPSKLFTQVDDRELFLLFPVNEGAPRKQLCRCLIGAIVHGYSPIIINWDHTGGRSSQQIAKVFGASFGIGRLTERAWQVDHMITRHA